MKIRKAYNALFGLIMGALVVLAIIFGLIDYAVYMAKQPEKEPYVPTYTSECDFVSYSNGVVTGLFKKNVYSEEYRTFRLAPGESVDGIEPGDELILEYKKDAAGNRYDAVIKWHGSK